MCHCCSLVISNTDKGFYATRSLLEREQNVPQTDSCTYPRLRSSPLWEREQNVPQTDSCPYPRLRSSPLSLWERVGVRGKSLL